MEIDVAYILMIDTWLSMSYMLWHHDSSTHHKVTIDDDCLSSSEVQCGPFPEIEYTVALVRVSQCLLAMNI